MHRACAEYEERSFLYFFTTARPERLSKFKEEPWKFREKSRLKLRAKSCDDIQENIGKLFRKKSWKNFCKILAKIRWETSGLNTGRYPSRDPVNFCRNSKRSCGRNLKINSQLPRKNTKKSLTKLFIAIAKIINLYYQFYSNMLKCYRIFQFSIGFFLEMGT